MPVQPGDWSGIEELRGPALVSRLLDNLYEILGDHLASPESEDARLTDLPEALQVLWHLNWLDFEVSQGSMLAYAFNSHGRHARLAANAFRRLGLHPVAALVDEVAAIRERGDESWSARHDQLDAMPAFSVTRPYGGISGADELGDLTDRYWDAIGDADWGEALEAFMEHELPSILRWVRRT